VFGRRPFGGFGRPAAAAPAGPAAPVPAGPLVMPAVPREGAAVPPATPRDLAPAHCLDSPGAARLVDSFYAAIPTAEVSYLFREVRKHFAQDARAEDGSGTLLSYVVPAGQTLLISDVEFFAQAHSQEEIEARRLAGYVSLHFLVDDRAPLDVYTEISAPQGQLGDAAKGSGFASLGHAFGGPGRQPFVTFRAREGQTVRLAYTTLRPPDIAVDEIGAALRGYIVPSALLAAKTCG
jgi:hypothetical protein